MSLNLNTALYNLKGVDTAQVESVSNKIFQSAQAQQPTVKSIDYSKFNRAALGVDLYSNRTAPELQKQIALTQAGLYAQAVNVAKLNTQAAINLYSAARVQKNVEMTQVITEGADLTAPKKLEENRTAVRLFNISDKNSNSHNGFNPFKANSNANEEIEK